MNEFNASTGSMPGTDFPLFKSANSTQVPVSNTSYVVSEAIAKINMNTHCEVKGQTWVFHKPLMLQSHLGYGFQARFFCKNPNDSDTMFASHHTITSGKMKKIVYSKNHILSEQRRIYRNR